MSHLATLAEAMFGRCPQCQQAHDSCACGPLPTITPRDDEPHIYGSTSSQFGRRPQR